MKQLHPNSIATFILTIAAFLLGGCSSAPKTHFVTYDLSPHVKQASSRYSMTPIQRQAEIAIECHGGRSESNIIANVSFYHCDGTETNSIGKFFSMQGMLHVLRSPEPLGRYVEIAAKAALASQGVVESPKSSRRLVLALEKFDYDEFSDHKKGPITPFSVFTAQEGVIRNGFMDVSANVMDQQGKSLYKRRFSIEASRKKGQASVTYQLLGNTEDLKKLEEQRVLTDVVIDLFAKFEDELAGDNDLIKILKN